MMNGNGNDNDNNSKTKALIVRLVTAKEKENNRKVEKNVSFL